jgi:hypothetical protein
MYVMVGLELFNNLLLYLCYGCCTGEGRRPPMGDRPPRGPAREGGYREGYRSGPREGGGFGRGGGGDKVGSLLSAPVLSEPPCVQQPHLCMACLGGLFTVHLSFLPLWFCRFAVKSSNLLTCSVLMPFLCCRPLPLAPTTPSSVEGSAAVVLSKEPLPSRQFVLATPCGTLLCDMVRLLLRQQQQRRLHQRQVVEL